MMQNTEFMKLCLWVYLSIGVISGFFIIDKISEYAIGHCFKSEEPLKKFIFLNYSKPWFKLLILGIMTFLWTPIMFVVINYSDND